MSMHEDHQLIQSAESFDLAHAAESLQTLADTPHRRLNALTGDWVLVSPHRMQRPWQGAVELAADVKRPMYDPTCYLCPGNVRAGGARNPRYQGPFVFDNDFAALRPTPPTDSAMPTVRVDDLLVAQHEPGRCRVVCFSPRHDVSLPDMDVPSIRAVVDVWADESERMGRDPNIGYVQIFENRGEMMGCSNPHPHGQIWAQHSIPSVVAQEMGRCHAHYTRHGRTLLADYLRVECELGARVVCANDGFVALVPFWAAWPFELLVVSVRPVARLSALTETERLQLADLLQRVTTRYDNLFATPFPYSAGVHQAPVDGLPHPEWHLHLHFYPPLLRSATVRKFVVGYELLANAQRDLTPEVAAAQLRAQSEILYRGRAA